MFSKFLNLDMEKQDRILNAAMKEFAQKGFEKASTNEIVKEADISKGLLFHYFKDKKNLFLFLYDHCIDVSTNEFYKKINLDEKDFFIRLNQMCIIKFELLNKYPEMFRFIETAYMETSKSVKKELDERKEKLIKINSIKVFEGFDLSKFKEDIDVKKAINVMIWTFQGLGDEALKKAKLLSLDKPDYSEVFAEADIYIDMFKNCFYK
ncbi:bacterial regulatory s, tetR family protein [Clostridium argentinense CDC 2741]|uniref:Bacterial regulatory s, tetR family protein n=1 Tax=Clostridium argentinense CDC 2741 TaxID=1418104 RepID=A0A0C1U9T9_9CLOT|nr:TetR/AcrR family transcriptional regulator [Clostridium argentinense]ARC86311.1 TetR family transcriptional regulator [Clostridium argentinense]KIE44375.1 bacterial regulatory s, tetR family protein [Clostridium argentinense CDC 2741]NFF40629.1 TetR/AcrR family transcriptional regulator [Clostridium argentinense]NFP51132.1 TetR/AcrR family transcriptional regulator [Clostridium argentinense]NFP73270.1 TetR/AcrR family transcriptional regulator [Clostridium argentinense]